MASIDVYIVRTGIANLASVQAGFRRIGANPIITEDPEQVENASYVMLPGVGAFGAAMKHLEACRLVEPLQQRFREMRPTMAICVGLQVLCQESEESPGVKGLGILDAKVWKFPNTVRVPQLGWNEVTSKDAPSLVSEGFAYFANSYYVADVSDGWKVTWATHGVPFIASMEKGEKLLACQFHPELSSAFGQSVLKNWLEKSSEGAFSC